MYIFAFLLRVPCFATHAPRVQVASFTFAAVFSGFWFVLWARMKLAAVKDTLLWDYRMGIWQQLGWFSGLVCAGSVAGAVAWGVNMQGNTLEFEGALAINATTQQRYALIASSFRWVAAFYTLYPVEFLCLIIPKLMLLRRLTNHATRHSKAQAPHVSGGIHGWASERAMERLYWVMAATVVLCSFAGMVAFVVAGVQDVQVAALNDQAGLRVTPLATTATRQSHCTIKPTPSVPM